MNSTDRYRATGDEAEFEPGSRGRVLRNMLGIVRVRDMEQAESEALEAVQEWAVGMFDAAHRFTADDICALHRQWLGKIYDFSPLARRGKKTYIGAIHASLDRDYSEMESCFKSVIARTLGSLGLARR